MRTIHADLKTAQELVSHTPYIVISINDVDGAGAVDYGTGNATNPLISFEWIEEPYRDSAIIVIDNSNRGLDPGTLDLRGSSFFIGTGYNTTSGNKYCGDGAGSTATPTLWVKTQHVTSMEGKVVCVLGCEGMWMKLRELKYLAVGDAPYYRYEYGGTQTIKEIIVLALAEASMTLNATVPDDGIVDTLKPFFNTSISALPSLASLLYNSGWTGLLQMTKEYLRPEASLVFKLIYPQDSDSVDETYYSDQVPYFREYTEKRLLLIPNDIKVFWGADDDGSWTSDTAQANLLLPGSAVDQTAIDAYTTVRHIFFAPKLTTQAAADLRADAILTRLKSEVLAGRLVLPYHDCSVELYDKVSVVDRRGA